MKLLELYVSVRGSSALGADSQPNFTISANGGAEFGEVEADSQLPFWSGKNRRRLALRTVETNSLFRADSFTEEEQEWMIQFNLLHPGRTGFLPSCRQTIGQALYNSLLPQPVAELFRSALQQAQRESTVLHLRLKFAADIAKRSRLADYPWELLHDGQRFLLQRGVQLSRYLAFETVPPQVTPTEQLQVWLVSSRASDDNLKLKPLPDQEKKAIQAGLLRAQREGTIALTTLRDGQFKTLKNQLADCLSVQSPQIVHFDGHGLYGQRCINSQCRRLHNTIREEFCKNPDCQQPLPAPEGFLIFEDEQGNADPVSAQDFASILQDGLGHINVQLVVLSACESGMAVAGESLFNGAAQQLIDHRIPAVVAMQYAVTVAAASEFSERFYQSLGKRASIAAAVSAGRQAMGRTDNQWYRPVLYLRSPCPQGGQLFCGESQTVPLSSFLENLYQLLRPVQVEIWPAIEHAHRAIVPNEFEQPSRTLRQKLRNLEDLPSQEKDKDELMAEVRFVDALLKAPSLPETLTQEVRNQLKDWAIRRDPRFEEFLNQQVAQPRDPERSVMMTQPTLILDIREGLQKKGQYLIGAGLVWYPSSSSSESTCSTSLGLGEFTIPALNQCSWLNDVLKFCSKEKEVILSKLSVECFLPLSLLHLAVDLDLRIERGRHQDVPLSTVCKSFVVRARDRHPVNRNHDDYWSSQNDWKDGWRHIEENRDSPWKSYFAMTQKENPLFLKWIQKQDSFTGGQLNMPQDINDREEILGTMLSKAVPIALWLRYEESQVGSVSDRDSSIESTSIKSVEALKDSSLADIPQSVTEVRDPESGCNPSDTQRLALLWDNPFRPLPAIVYTQPSSTPAPNHESETP